MNNLKSTEYIHNIVEDFGDNRKQELMKVLKDFRQTVRFEVHRIVKNSVEFKLTDDIIEKEAASLLMGLITDIRINAKNKYEITMDTIKKEYKNK